MPSEALVAVISGAAGLIGAVFAWIQAVRANRLKADVDISLERIKSETLLAIEAFKAENERRRKAFEVASQTCAPVETALDQAWQDIQTIKEVIAKLLSPVRYDKDIALNSLRPVVLSIENGYSHYGAGIPEVARNAWHVAKNRASLVEQVVSEQDDVHSLSTALIERLEKFRRELTDQQIAIVGAREGLRGALMERLLHLI